MILETKDFVGVIALRRIVVVAVEAPEAIYFGIGTKENRKDGTEQIMGRPWDYKATAG